MTFEQKAQLNVPPSKWQTKPYQSPRPDYSANWAISDLPLARQENGTRVPAIYRKGEYPSISAPSENLPKKKKIRKLTAKVPKLEAPPHDASGHIVIKTGLNLKGKRVKKPKAPRAKRSSKKGVKSVTYL